MTEPMMLEPYWSSDLSTWVFDDASVGLTREPFVSGAEKGLDLLAQDIPDARDGFRLFFSDAPFPGFQRSFTWKRAENGGNWYGLDGSSLEGWLCSQLYKYFSTAPAKLYVSAKPRQE
jgi:hypothetical protein